MTPAASLSALRRLVRIDARRPASWLGLLVAAAAAWAEHSMAAMCAGALATVTTVGVPPLAPTGRLGLLWIIERSAWSVAGAAIGAIASCALTDSPRQYALAAWLGATLAAANSASLWRARLPAADVASLGIVIAAASVAAGMVAGSILLAMVTWCVLAASMAWLLRSHGARVAVETGLSRSSGDIAGVGMVSQSTSRRHLGRLAMASMVAVMAAWLLLDPRSAGPAALVGATWMVALAVPAAFLQERAHPSWRSLLRSTAGHHRTVFGAPQAGSPKNVAIRHAAVLGWPGVVAAVVAAGGPAGPWPGIWVTLCIAAVATIVVCVDLACESRGGSPETSMGLTLSIVGVILLLASWTTCLPKSPWLPARRSPECRC